MNHDLTALGWSAFFEGARRQADRPHLFTSRVVADHGHALRLSGDIGDVLARPHRLDPAAVGDWVLHGRQAGDERVAIEVRLARRTELVRAAAGRRTAAQVVAANLDVIFIVTSPDDLNERRLERYLAAVHAGGAEPVVVINKADLGRPGLELPGGVPVLHASAATGDGVDALRSWLGAGRSGGFVGMSGVGKSSLVNALRGDDALATGAIRDSDGTGKHTTTWRELVVLDDGAGVLIDTPGMRELGLWDGDGLAAVFDDLESLAAGCRYRDCQHDREDGCALQAAVDAGELGAGRVSSWLSLRREVKRTAERRDVAAERREQKRRGKLYREILRHKRGR